MIICIVSIIHLVFIDLFHIKMMYILSCDIFLYLNKKNSLQRADTQLVIKNVFRCLSCCQIINDVNFKEKSLDTSTQVVQSNK
jgi:hypothetical protein